MSRVTVITLSTLLLVGLVVAVTIGVLNIVNDDGKKPSTSTKAVQEICQPTDYKEACFKSLAKANTDDPKELVRATFESTKAEISEAVSKSPVLIELEKDPKTAEAVKDCKELFQDAIDDLQRSFDEIGTFEFSKVNQVLENLKVWLSASLTYQETCLDGFDNSTDASTKVRKILQTAMQMSSNGLAIVSEMSTLLGTLDVSSFNRRRLLSDDRYVVGHNDVIPYVSRNRRLLISSADQLVVGHEDGNDDALNDNDQLDQRRRKLLSSYQNVAGHDDDEMPIWLEGHRRKLLQATNLAEDLKSKANVVVAQDGSGKYKTIEEALKDIPKRGNESYIIYIKEGVYNEYLVLYKTMTNVVFIGDGPTKTRITNNKNFADGVRTFKTATLSVLGDGFMAKDIGVENSAGAIKHQAVALRVQSDKAIFYNCHFDGYQDTLYTHTYRQFYRDCRVTGTIDFIFGDAAAFFQNCTFVVRKPLENQRCIVTAQGRTERHQPTGIIIHKSRFEADPDYYPVRTRNTAYLGRPWKEYSKTVIMESYIDDSIAPEGWLPWEGTFGLETCYYGEYNNVGPGSNMDKRVKWRGIKTIIPTRAEKFMPPLYYENDDWIKASGIPYDPFLSAFAPGPAGFEGLDEDPNAPAAAPLPYSSSGLSASSSSSSYGSSSSSSSSDKSSSSSSSSSDQSSSASTSSGSSSTDPSSSSTSSGSSSTDPSSSSTSSGSSSTDPSSSSSSSSSSSDGSSSQSVIGNQEDASESYRDTPSTGSSADGVVSQDDPSSTPPTSTPAPSPTILSPSPSQTPVLSPSETTTSPSPSATLSPTDSPSMSPAQNGKKKRGGPMTLHEVERVLMTDEDMGEDENAEEVINDDMSGNVPDGDEPSPATVPPPSPTPAPSPSDEFSPISSPSLSPSDELGDWLPPATAPEPDVEPADKEPPKVSPPPKKSNAISSSKYGLHHVVLSTLVMWVALVM